MARWWCGECGERRETGDGRRQPGTAGSMLSSPAVPGVGMILPMASVTLDWLHLITLLGAIQGICLAGALATRRRNRTANRLLAGLMLSFSVYLASVVYHAAGYVRSYPHFFGIAYPLPFLFGPLVYLYAVTAADRTRRLTGRDALHLLPFLLVVLAGLPIYLLSGAEKVAFYDQLQAGVRPLLLRIADPLRLLSGVSYAAAVAVTPEELAIDHRELFRGEREALPRFLCSPAAAFPPNVPWYVWHGRFVEVALLTLWHGVTPGRRLATRHSRVPDRPQQEPKNAWRPIAGNPHSFGRASPSGATRPSPARGTPGNRADPRRPVDPLQGCKHLPGRSRKRRRGRPRCGPDRGRGRDARQTSAPSPPDPGSCRMTWA